MFLLGMLFSAAPAIAAPFGDTVSVSGVRVSTIFKSASGAVYVTFSPSLLNGCFGGYGGYLTSTWSEAQSGAAVDPDSPKMQLAILLAAKALESTMEVRYRVNASGTAWDRCAIDAIGVQ